MKKPDKFQVGDTAWLPGNWRGHERDKFVPYQVTERTKTGYIMQPPGVQIGTLNLAEKVSTIKANRDYLTAGEKDGRLWIEQNRWKVVREVERASDDMIRKIARNIGYVPEPK